MNLRARWEPYAARAAAAGRIAGPALPVAVLAGWVALVHQSGRWPSGDGPHVLGTAMRLSQMLRDLDLLTWARSLGSLVGPHPPGAYLPAMAAYAVLGTEWRGVHLLAVAFVLWLCWDGVRRLGGGPVGGLFLGASAAVWAQAECYGIDLLAGACVVQAASHLVASRRLEVRRHAILWGAWMGAGFLTKYTAPLFLWGPCIPAAVWVVAGRRWRALGLAVGAFALVAGGWYAAHLDGVAGYVRASGDAGYGLLTNRALVEGPWWAPRNLSWYPLALLDAWGWPGAVAILVGVAWRARRPDFPAGSWLVPALAVAGGMLALDLQVQRQDRYLLPVFPLLSALVGSSRPRWVLAPIGAVGLYGTAAVFATWRAVPPHRDFTHPAEGAGRDWPWPQESYRPTSLDPRRWKVDEMLRAAREAEGSDEGTIGLYIDETGGAPGFGLMLSRTNALGYRWHLATVMAGAPGRGGGPPGGEDLGGSGLPGDPPVFVGPFHWDGWPPRRFDTLVAVTRRDDRQRLDWIASTGFEECARWDLPNGTRGMVLRRRE